MAVDIGFTVRRLLLECKDAGIEIKVQDNKLAARGSKDRTDLYEKIKKNKKTIIEAMTNIPEAVEVAYLSRLRAGQEYLQECMERLEGGWVDKDKERRYIERVAELLCKWQLLDDEMRRLFPEYRGCPLVKVGGCDFAIIPVKCQECAE